MARHPTSRDYLRRAKRWHAVWVAEGERYPGHNYEQLMYINLLMWVWALTMWEMDAEERRQAEVE
jgi:hypothetical protein